MKPFTTSSSLIALRQLEVIDEVIDIYPGSLVRLRLSASVPQFIQYIYVYNVKSVQRELPYIYSVHL